MISSVSLDRSNLCFSSDSAVSDQTTIQKIVDVAYQKIWVPISTGIIVGIGDLTFNVLLDNVLSLIPGFESFLADPSIAAEYMEQVLGSFWDTAIEGPFWEEMLFRGLLQEFFHWMAEKILPDRDVALFFCKMKLATLVSIVATAVLFGSVHLSSGFGISHAILATVTGITYGILRERYGLRASISAHMTNNAIVFGLIRGGLVTS